MAEMKVVSENVEIAFFFFFKFWKQGNMFPKVQKLFLTFF